MSRGPDYLRDLLRRLPAELSEAELFLHLGYWDDGVEGVRAAQARLNDVLLDALDVRSGQRVLDVACGIGGTLAALAQREPSAELTGVNIDEAQLDVARRSVAHPVRWVCADACALPFEAASFERVVSVEAAFHFSSRRRFLAEVARVLVPGGVVVLSDLVVDLAADGERVREITEGLGPWPDPMLTSGSLAELCVAAGLCVVEERDLTPLVAPTFEAMLGPHAIANPSSVADAGDRGTAALGALCRTGHLRVVLLKAQLKA
ncbi:MAG: methyltransferase domain-containing protein [Polyangiaceae bacterium]|nr:methyltransferase domain-containing protein [Polyangiaceae bacterium]